MDAELQQSLDRAGERRRRERETVWFVELVDGKEAPRSYFVVGENDLEARDAAITQEKRRHSMIGLLRVNKVERLGPVLLVDRLLALEDEAPEPTPLRPVSSS